MESDLACLGEASGWLCLAAPVTKFSEALVAAQENVDDLFLESLISVFVFPAGKIPLTFRSFYLVDCRLWIVDCQS